MQCMDGCMGMDGWMDGWTWAWDKLCCDCPDLQSVVQSVKDLLVLQ